MGVMRLGSTAQGPIRLTVEVEGYEKIDVGLSRLGRDVTDWRPFWIDHFAPQFFGDAMRNIEASGRYVGGWPPLSPGYAAWKSARYPGKPIMVLHGALKESFTWRGDHPGAGGVFRATANAAEMGSGVLYAQKHQTGQGDLPQRRLIFLASSQTYGRLLQRYLVERVREAGLS